jgi:uncharacterized membrane protein YagU involved in acid resistance
MADYNPQAVIDCERKLKAIVDKHPEYRDTVEEAVGHLTWMWCRIALVREAVK